MNIDPEILKALTIFLIPGVVIDFMIRQLIAIRADKSSFRILYFAFFSLMNYACFFWLLDVIPQTFSYQFFGLIITSAFLGLIISCFIKTRIFSIVFGSLRFTVKESEQTAWEKFTSSYESRYVIVHLKSGGFIRGLFGPQSAASDDIEHLDLFLEQTYLYSDKDGWYPDESNQGIYLPYSEIKAVEFMR